MHPLELAGSAEAVLPYSGTGSFDLRRLELHGSAEAAALHGLPGVHTPGLSRALDCIEPLDRAQLIAAVLQCVQRDGVFECDVRLTTPQGLRKLVRLFGHVENDAGGTPVALHGLVEDVNEGERAPLKGEAWLAQLVLHELRSRTATFDGHLAELERAEGPSLTSRGMYKVASIRRAGAQIEQVIDALAQLCTDEPLRRERINLSDLANELLQELREREPSRRVEITIRPGIEVVADRGLLTLLLRNLLSNAWKFSAVRSLAHISVDASGAAGQLVVQVEDNGIGFEAHDASRIFRLFTRLESARSFEGSGVGLALAWRVVQRHGGLIWAHGEAGQGAAFYFRL